MSINPVQFAHSVCDEFLRYLFSAFPLSDPDLRDQFRKLLDRPSSLDIPLVNGPFVSLSEAFSKGDPVQHLADGGLLHHAMPGLIGYPSMYLHQQKVLEAVKGGRHILVATGTGSGKTESFLYPIVDDLLRQRDKGIREGLTAILVYPMNALANDQLDRLRDMLGGTGITFGQWIGTTPTTEGEVGVERFNGSSRPAYLETRRKRRDQAQAEDRAVRPLAPPEECCSEEDIRTRKPRILVTNYRQLEVLATRLPDVALFAEAPLRYLVFDEAHTYAGATGAEVACLIRRLRALARKKTDEVVCIGTSATLADPSGTDASARRFASRFFGVDPEQVTLVGESYVRREWPNQRHRPVAPQGDGMARLGRVLEAITEPADVTAIKTVVEELTGQLFDPGEDWAAALFDHLIANEYVYQATDVLKQPGRLADAGWHTSQRLRLGRLPQGDSSTAELLAYLVLGAAARKGRESLLRPKVHFFLRGLDEMVVAVDGTPDTTTMGVFLSPHDARATHPGRRDAAFFPVLVCRGCGQHFLEQWYQGLELSRGTKKQLKGFEHGNAVEDDGRENAVWATAPPGSGIRLVLTHRLLEEADSGPTARSLKWPRAYVCRQCGAMHRDSASRCLADGCGHPQPPVPLVAFGDRISACPSCSTPSFRIGGRELEPARKVQAATVSDVHILAQAMINAAAEGHKKLIIFADSRQDAAFQAGWMQDHARRIRLRHMMNAAITGTNAPMSLDEITDRLMEAFRSDQNLIDTLLPELTGEDAQALFGHNRLTAVHRALRYMVLREFTTGVRRTDCLESMGLARVYYQGLTPTHTGLANWADLVGITPEEAVEAVAILLDLWRRSRLLYVRADPVFSRYHPKDDPYIQAGLLNLREFRPEALELEPKENDYLRSLLARKGASAVQALVRRWSPRPEQLDVDVATERLWKLLTEELQLLTRVELRSQRETRLADGYQIDAEKVVVLPSQERVRCTTCQRVTARTSPRRVCTRHNCSGTTVAQKPDAENYDVWLMGRPFTMVTAEEHTAQVPGEVRDKIEQDFKSRNGRTNCLVATPTLEMGVNIGALDMALMRNVPPRSANYWQRAGRAGREERMAVVVTYCRRSNHDRYFFDDPFRLLGGAIDPPAFNLRNPLMVGKHVRSALLSELLLSSRQPGPQGEQVREVLNAHFPPFVREYLLDSNDHFRDAPQGAGALAAVLQSLRESLVNRLVVLFARHWPSEAAEMAGRTFIEQTIDGTASVLDEVVARLHRRLTWARTTRSELHRKKDAGLIEREEEQLLRRCDEFVNSIVKRDRSTYTLTVLAVEGFLPGYGIYDSGVTASARRGFARQVGPRAFDLSRSPVVALREFVPGNRLYANRGSFYVARYHLAAEDAGRIKPLRVNPDKGYVTEASGDSTYGQSGGVPIDALPLTDLDLAPEGRITEEENLRFSMPVTVLGRLRRSNRGGKGHKIGEYEVSHLRGQGVELVNVGEAGRVRMGELGHWVCAACGAAKTPYAVPQEIAQFLKIHKERCGREPIRLALTAQADVDAIQFHAVGEEANGVNIGEAVRTAAARLLDMGPDDLQLLLVRKPNDILDLLLYDPMPGGSGLLEQILERWREVIATARELLAGCVQGCDTACYACLKTFRNQFHHDRLNRHDALALMEKLDHDPEAYREITPVFEEQGGGTGTPSNTPEARLQRLLLDHHFPPGECRKAVRTSVGLTTEPDWLYPESKVAVYLDGMSRGLHGDPKQAKKDLLIRGALEADDYKVVVIQSRDLADPEAVRQHLKNIAEAIGRADLPFFGDGPAILPPAVAADGPGLLVELLSLCDARCQALLRACGEAGKPLPVLGYELRDDTGRITPHQAELAWESVGVAVVLPETPEAVSAFRDQGWTVFPAEEAGSEQQILDLLTE